MLNTNSKFEYNIRHELEPFAESIPLLVDHVKYIDNILMHYRLNYIHEDWFSYSYQKFISENNISKIKLLMPLREEIHSLLQFKSVNYPLLESILNSGENAGLTIFNKYIYDVINSLFIVLEEHRFIYSEICKEIKNEQSLLNIRDYFAQKINELISITFSAFKFQLSAFNIGKQINPSAHANISVDSIKLPPPWGDIFKDREHFIVSILHCKCEHKYLGKIQARYIISPSKVEQKRQIEPPMVLASQTEITQQIKIKLPAPIEAKIVFSELLEQVERYMDFIRKINNVDNEVTNKLSTDLSLTKHNVLTNKIKNKYNLSLNNASGSDYIQEWDKILNSLVHPAGKIINNELIKRLQNLPSEDQRKENFEKTFLFEFVDHFVNYFLIYLEELNNLYCFAKKDYNGEVFDKLCEDEILEVKNSADQLLDVKFQDIHLFTPIDDYPGNIIHVNEEISDIYKNMDLPKRYILEIKRFGYEAKRSYEREKTEVIVS